MSMKTFQWKHPRCLRKGDTFKLRNGHTRVVRQVSHKKGPRLDRSFTVVKAMHNDRVMTYVYVGLEEVRILRTKS